LETRDVSGALSYLKSRGVTEAGIYGISMGGATAIMAAGERPEIVAVVSESAYSDLGTLIDQQFPKVSGLPALFTPGMVLMANLLYGMDASKARPAAALSGMGDRPVLLIHSTSDEFVPVSHAYALQEAARSNPNLDFWIVENAAHCEAFSTYRAEYTQRILAFFDRYMR
jgi:fermentation-respiration switch protein FrsA (DUF1100 family)